MFIRFKRDAIFLRLSRRLFAMSDQDGAPRPSTGRGDDQCREPNRTSNRHQRAPSNYNKLNLVDAPPDGGELYFFVPIMDKNPDNLLTRPQAASPYRDDGLTSRVIDREYSANCPANAESFLRALVPPVCFQLLRELKLARRLLGALHLRERSA